MLKITHDSGFFSCCSVKLYEIIKYFNKKQKLPDLIDCSKQFSLYKPTNTDITYEYFLKNDKNIVYNSFVDFHWIYQFNDFKTIKYNILNPCIIKYFMPTNEIITIIKKIEYKYSLDYSNICVLFYRGNDKKTEMKLCSYQDIIDKAHIVYQNNQNIKFLIQSDETEFINTMLDTPFINNNSICFHDEIRHINKMISSVDIINKNKDNINFIFSKKYLAITIIMSKCKYIVCGSGNCSLWIMLYRGNSHNVIQYLEGEWIT